MTDAYDGDDRESRAAFRAYDSVNEPVSGRSTWQIWRDACAWQAARATAEQSAKLQAVKDAGFKMSNIFFNLAQRPGEPISADMCAVLDTCRKEWDEAIRALKSQQDAAIEHKPAEQILWQPIETAPKTGRTLLLGYPNSLGNWRTVRGEWLTQEYIDQNWEEPDEAEAGWYETSVEADDVPSCWPIAPTHWQPLPKPPADAAIESQRSGDGS